MSLTTDQGLGSEDIDVSFNVYISYFTVDSVYLLVNGQESIVTHVRPLFLNILDGSQRHAS